MNLKTNRSVILYYILCIITLGIYGLYFIHALARDVNRACSEDGRHTSGLLKYILFSIITLGIYSIVWNAMLAGRTNSFVVSAGSRPRISIASYLIWTFVGSLLFGLGPIIAFAKNVHQVNDVCIIANNTTNLSFSDGTLVR